MKISLLSIVTALSVATITQAELITYDLQWSGLSFQNNASATGQVTIDTDLVPNPGSYGGEWAGSAFSNFSITVVGALSGNGTFSTATNDFSEVVWFVGEPGGPGLGDGEPVDPVDLYSELIGQPTFFDFNVFGSDQTPLSPTGWEPFVLQTGGLTLVPSDLIRLVSMQPVPAPSSIALLGLGALATTRRRR